MAVIFKENKVIFDHGTWARRSWRCPQEGLSVPWGVSQRVSAGAWSRVPGLKLSWAVLATTHPVCW